MAYLACGKAVATRLDLISLQSQHHLSQLDNLLWLNGGLREYAVSLPMCPQKCSLRLGGSSPICMYLAMLQCYYIAPFRSFSLAIHTASSEFNQFSLRTKDQHHNDRLFSPRTKIEPFGPTDGFSALGQIFALFRHIFDRASMLFGSPGFLSPYLILMAVS